MPKYTEALKLYEFDPQVDDAKNTTFNVQTFLNDNFDKLDANAKKTGRDVGALQEQLGGVRLSVEDGCLTVEYEEDK